MNELPQVLATSALLIGAVTWLAQNLVKHFLDKDVESYKEKLGRETEVALERLRTDLRQQEFVFQRLHERQATVLSDLYSHMADAVGAVHRYMESSPVNQVPQERFDEAHGAVTRFGEHFERNRIWLEPQVAQEIEMLLREHNRGILYKFYNIQFLRQRGLGQTWSDQELQELWRRTQEDVPRILRALESHFRRILGFSTGDTATSRQSDQPSSANP